MAKSVDWESRIGRRIRLRDLHILFAVAQFGSMAKAAAHLRVTQPAVSKAIGDLEAAVGARLLDRSPHGVEPTMYGQALLRSGLAAFDELRQGIRNIEHLADPTAGELRIGCQATIAATILPPMIEHLVDRYPRLDFHVTQLISPTFEFPELRHRTIDLMLALLPGPLAGKKLGDTVIRAPFGGHVKDRMVTQGQYVKVQVVAGRRQAIVVPQTAVLQNETGRYVWTIGPEGKAAPRNVRTGNWVGRDWVILDADNVQVMAVMVGMERVKAWY